MPRKFSYRSKVFIEKIGSQGITFEFDGLKKTEVLTVKVSSELLSTLDKLARKWKVPRSQLIRFGMHLAVDFLSQLEPVTKGFPSPLGSRSIRAGGK